ncbi:PAS domain S-box protein [Larkinella insperata]|uniref:histidine kinase n=1 Tax=Larkinella insperata TaxID=332158 RepID=A0ABW3QD18_9BACT
MSECQPDPLLASYRMAFEAMSQGFCLLEKVPTPEGAPSDFRYLLTNPAFQQQSGLEQVVGKTLLEVLPQTEASVLAYYDQVAVTGQPAHFQVYLSALKGWMDTHAFRLEGHDTPCIAVLFTNITDRKQAEETLQNNHTWLTLAMNSARAGWGIWEFATDQIQWSPESRQILGLDSGEEYQTTQVWFDRIHPDDRAEVQAAITQMKTQNKEFNCEYRVRKPDGQERWIRGSGKVLVDANGQAYRSTGLVFDITERKQMEHALRESQERQAFLLQLSDALRALSDATTIKATASQLLGQYMGVDRVFYAERIEPADEEGWRIENIYHRPAYPFAPGLYSLQCFGAQALCAFPALTVMVEDVVAHKNVPEAVQKTCRLHSIAAYVYLPLVKHGECVALLGMHQATPRPWKPEEILLVEEVAQRTWASVEQARAELTRRQSEEKYRTLFNSIDEAYVFCQILTNAAGQPVDYRFLEMNPAFERLTGLPIAGVLGKTARQVLPDLEDSWIETYGRVALKGETVRFENRVGQLDRWYDVYAGPVGGGGSGLFAVVFKDITERKRQQTHQVLLAEITEAIAEEVDVHQIMSIVGEKLMRTFPISSFSIWEIRPQVDEACRRFMWAKEALELPQRAHLSAFFSPEAIRRLRQGENVIIADTQTDARANAPAFKALNIGSYLGLPYRQQVSWQSMLVLFSPIAYGWQPDQIALLTDVMNRLLPRIERAQAEAALRASEARLTAFFDSLPIGVAEVDTQGRLLLANREMQRFLPTGLIPSQDKDRHDRWRAYHADGRRLWPDEYPGARALRGERVVPGIEMLYTPEEGGPIWTRMAAVPIRDDEGRVMGMVALISDISGLKQAEEALKEASRRKDEFLAMLAHELRNPLASIRLGMGLLDYAPDPVLEQTVNLINGQVDHLVRLVDELLDVSRISRGKIQLKPERLELGALVARSVETMRPQFEAQQRQLHYRALDRPVYVQGDATRLSQVVTNLLVNGLRYTKEQGQVWVSLTVQDRQATLRVRDNGIGLAVDQLTTIFELFVQVDTSLARQQGGLGIGLTLVQRLVEKHGGRVEAHSPGLGKGSEFVVYLPLLEEQHPAALPPASSPAAVPAGAGRILVIDDNIHLALLLAQTLRLKGYEVHTCYSGREGLEEAQVLRPAVILCDIGMPGLDGYQTAQMIRQQPWGQAVRLIALTGYGGPEDRRRAKEAGFDHHLVKPVDLDALLGLLVS